jgi:hypothetical protein
MDENNSVDELKVKDFVVERFKKVGINPKNFKILQEELESAEKELRKVYKDIFPF